MVEYYSQLRYKTDQIYHKYSRRYNIIAILRFFLFISTLLFLLMGYFYHISVLYCLSVMSLFVFFILVRIHKKVQDQMHYYQSLLQVYQQHIERIQGKWSCFQEDGQKYIYDHQQSDLDILGHHSLFQMINICHSEIGKEKLAASLCQHQKNDHIEEIQKAVIELSKYPEMICDIEAYGQRLNMKEEMILQDYLRDFKSIEIKKVPQIIFLISFITIASLFVLSFFPSKYASMLLEIGFVSQLVMTTLLAKKHQYFFLPLKQLQQSLHHYDAILQRFNEEHFESSLLKSIQKRLFDQYHAIKAIDELSHLATMASYRHNLFAWILFNGLFMYDIYLRNRYINWINVYGQYLEQLLDLYGDLEVYMSLSIPQIDGFNVTMPHISNQMNLSFEDLRHPLISQELSKGNSFQNHSPLCIITGSNMSGKTTFMRTIGLNLSLAYAGGYIFGTSMECCWMRIMTSMRIQDNVEEGISTFYNELLRIKEMIEFCDENVPMICLIDEIFKGTNSLDRIAGAKATLKKLSQNHVMTFVTTHDFELCQIDDLFIDNYHFDESYHDGKIYFDYQLKKGQSQTTNGQFLLQQLGILK